MQKPEEPLVRDYRVGLVVPRCGINASQVAAITLRLRQAAALLPGDGALTLRVPAYEDAAADGAIQAEVLNLGRLHKVHFVVDRPAPAPQIVVALRDCDEVWCCPEITHTGRSKARANAVYQLAQQTEWAARYKRIPPWVEVPAPQRAEKVKPKKETRLW